MIRTFFLWISLVIGMAVNSYGNDFVLTPNLQLAYQELTQLKVQHARQLLAQESPTNGIKIWLDDFADMIVLFATEDEAAYNRLVDQEDERLDLIEKMDDTSPYNRFIRAEINFHWALVKMKLGHESKGGFNAISAYKLLEENRKKFPTFSLNNKSLGLLHVLIGSVPENYRWITRLLGLKGNIQQGLKELDMAANDKFIGKEAKFYQLFIQSNILTLNDRERQEVLDFVHKNPDNLAVSFLGTSISLKDNKSEQALKIVQSRPTGSAYLNLPIFDLYQGEIALQKGQYAQAIKSYQAYLRVFRGHSFQKDATYKLALSYWLANNSEQALAYLNRINGIGKKLSEADKNAQSFYESFQKTKTFPSKNLLKARFAFDGGYNTEALEALDELTEANFTNPLEKVEFNYRKARIYQKINQPNVAIPLYVHAIELAGNLNTYFAPTSCLQLGYSYLAKNDKARARSYFEKALTYKKHEYKNSIDNKAQAALTELGV